MDFPGPPPPLSLSEYLDWMRTDLSGLYILGSLNRHITVHSQQCRAINLIRALMGDGRALEDKSVAIVGASERAKWPSHIYTNLRDFGYAGRRPAFAAFFC